MKIEIELDDKAIQAEIVNKVANNLTFEAKNEMYKMVKDIILGEIRNTIKAQTAEILTTMTMPDGKSFKQYVIDRINGVRSGYNRERVGVEGLVEQVIQTKANTWFNELVEPKMVEIKARIKEEILGRLMRESV